MSSMINVASGYFSFGSKTILSDVSLNISRKDKICLIGRNGAGKSSLFKILSGEFELDKGEKFVHPQVRIGYLSQSVNLIPNQTIYESVLEVINSNISEDISDKKYLIDIILEKLNLHGDTLVSNLSGGKERIVGLARCLVMEPDVLLLDEPTNHLDIVAIQWLEEYLANFKGAVLIISHDRAFLSRVTNKTFWLYENKIYTNPTKGFSDFPLFQEQVLAQKHLALQKMSKELEKEELWLQQGVTARRKRNQQRLSNLIKLRSDFQNNKDLLNQENKKITVDKYASSSKSRIVVELQNIGFSFEDRQIIKSFSHNILKGDVIGVVGRNGSGKTTLINLIAGRLPVHSGSIKYAPNLFISVFDQSKKLLDDSKTLKDNFCSDGSDYLLVRGQTKTIYSYLDDFLFTKRMINTPIESFSGGEKARAMLAKIFSEPSGLMILDEPTNDLDVETIDILIEMISQYDGALIAVSHDRDFLDHITNKRIVIDNTGKVSFFLGNDFDYSSLNTKDTQVAQKKSPTQAILKPQRKLSYNDQRRLEMLPNEINNLEKEIEKLTKIIEDPSLYNEQKEYYSKIIAKLSDCHLQLEQCEQEWIRLEELKDSIKG